MTTKDFAQMSISQRITLVEDIWDSLSEDMEAAKPSEVEKEFVNARLAEIKGSRERLVNWNVVKAGARARRK